MYASRRVANPTLFVEWRNESEGRLGRLRWDGAHSDTPAPSTDLEILRKV